MSTPVTRRTFLTSAAAAGAALTIRFPLTRPGAADAAAAYDPNAALTITPDGLVTVHITKAEMGQGVGTALAQIVAEELEVDWKDVRIDYPTSDPKFGLMLTGGSKAMGDATGDPTPPRAWPSSMPPRSRGT